MCDEDYAAQLAEALAGKLTEFGIAADRGWLPTYDAEDLSNVVVTVTPTAHAQSLRDRASDYQDVELRITVTKQIRNSKDVAEIDGVAAVMAAVKRLYANPAKATAECPYVGALRRQPLAGAKWTGRLENNPLFDPQLLRDSKIYLSQTVVAYRGAY